MNQTYKYFPFIIQRTHQQTIKMVDFVRGMMHVFQESLQQFKNIDILFVKTKTCSLSLNFDLLKIDNDII